MKIIRADKYRHQWSPADILAIELLEAQLDRDAFDNKEDED